MAKYDLIAATGCVTGIAHTYMAQEALEQAAEKMGYTIKVETHGQTGVDDPLTDEEIKNAKAVVVASDIDVDADRFNGLPYVMVPVVRGIKEPEELIQQALAKDAPIYHAKDKAVTEVEEKSSSQTLGQLIYTSLMNGVSHMLPLVVAGGVLIAISFFWGIYSADPESDQYNQFAATLNQIGSASMGLMVPVISAYIAETLAKRSGLIVGFVVGTIAMNNGTGFLGGIVGGFLAGGMILLLQRAFKPLPDREFRGLKAIFLYPVLGVFLAGYLMWILSSPMSTINTSVMDFLKGMQDANPILLGVIVGAMAAFDFGGPVNKAAYLTGTALLAQGNYLFMAGVSAACIQPPLATGIAVLLNKKAYTKDERSAGYVNFLLGSTHITEGAIPFAAKNPLVNIPIFMFGAAISSALTYVAKIEVPAPHGGFIILPLVNKPFLWVLFILIGAFVSGGLLAYTQGRFNKKRELEAITEIEETKQEEEKGSAFEEILSQNSIELNVKASTKEEVLNYLGEFAVKQGLATDSEAVIKKYHAREEENSTGMENGIAIPHAQDKSILKSSMVILKLAQPVDWNSLDGKPTDTIISFLIPENGSKSHLNYLSETAKLLIHPEFIQQLKEADTVDKIYNLFNKK